MAETCRTHGAADVEVYPTDLTNHAAVDSLAKQLLEKHKVCMRRHVNTSGMPHLSSCCRLWQERLRRTISCRWR